MIQRIQTLYLLGSFILIGIMFLFPLAELIDTAGQTYQFLYRGIPAIAEDAPAIFMAYPVAILLSIIALISLVTIFLYKKRMLQIRLTIFNMVCMLGAMGLIYYSINSQAKELNAVADYNIINAFPLVAVVFSYLALRNIGKDEAMIRSMDRIR
jgi:drug/metabolite transporter (DMT)-like permease